MTKDAHACLVVARLLFTLLLGNKKNYPLWSND